MTAFVQNHRIRIVEYMDIAIPVGSVQSAWQEEGMRLLKILALVVTLAGGWLTVGAAPATAGPLAAGAMATSQSQSPLVEKAQYRRHYRPYRRPYYGRPSYARPYYGRPYYVAPRRVYRGPRVVCRTQWRTVRTRYGWERRPVRVCTRRW